MKILKMSLITIFLVILTCVFVFAAFPNNTGRFGFETNVKNVLLFCGLPFLIAFIFTLGLLILIRKNKSLVLYTAINLIIVELIMIAYTIFLYYAASPGWFGIYINITTDISLFVMITYLFYRYKKIKNLVLV